MCLRWATLKATLVERRSKLGESKTIQQFSRDAEDIEAWVSEKLQTVLDESYKDPTNLQVTARFIFLTDCMTCFLLKQRFNSFNCMGQLTVNDKGREIPGAYDYKTFCEELFSSS